MSSMLLLKYAVFFSCTPLQKLSKTAGIFTYFEADFDNFRNDVQEKNCFDIKNMPSVGNNKQEGPGSLN